MTICSRDRVKAPISLTVDVEAYGVQNHEEFSDLFKRVINGFLSHNIKATIFVCGELLSALAPELARLHLAGCEVGLHGYSHRRLVDLGESRAKSEILRGFHELSTVLNQKPLGFRAPYFSLTREVSWAPQVLVDAGFLYSSSVLPAFNPQCCLPNAPKMPFRWPCGLIEFPVPVFGIRNFSIPVIGGGYLRVLPKVIVSAAKRSASKTTGSWTYAHPYDFDYGANLPCDPKTPWIVRKLIGIRRSVMLSRILEVADPTALTLGEIATNPEFTLGLETWQPRTQ